MCPASVIRLLFCLGCFFAFIFTAQGTTRRKVSTSDRYGRQSGTGSGPDSVGKDIISGDVTNHGDKEFKVDLSDQEILEDNKEDWQRRLEK